MEHLSDRYVVADRPPEGWSLDLGHDAPANGLALASRLLYNRGINDDPSAAAFLKHELANLSDPFDLPDMERAVSELMSAISANKHITVYGDFDADGITATAILKLAFRRLGVECDYYLPERESEGHGLSADAIRKLHESGTEVLITVDTGTTAYDEVALARQLGMNVIITDHHLPDDRLPPATAIVNPHLAGSDTELADYCGAGIAFKLATAMFRSAGVDDADYLLPLAAVGTVADRADLKGDNRIIVREGLKKLSGKDTLPGLSALMRVTSKHHRGNLEFDSEFIGFQVAPRLNAPGRLGSADISVELLTSDDYAEAMSKAEEINEQNQKRRDMAKEVLASVSEQVERAVRDNRRVVFVKLGDTYPLGMLGPLAGTLNDDTGRPAVAYKFNGQLAKASARSRGNFDIHRALNGISHKLVRFGGHAAAAGFQVDSRDIDEMAEYLDQQAKWHEVQSGMSPEVNGNGSPIRTVDAQVDLSQIGGGMWDFVRLMRPFGSGNEEPRFLIKGARVAQSNPVGMYGKQLSAVFVDDLGIAHRAFGWGLGGLAPLPPVVDAVVSLRDNNFNGKLSRELRLHDIAPSESV